MIDIGSFGSTQIRNGTQYFVRGDVGFKKDRVYGSLFRTLLDHRRSLAHASILGPESHLAMGRAGFMDPHLLGEYPE